MQAIYVPADDLTDPAPANTFAHLDATTVLSRAIVEKGIYPAVDPLDSTSRALQPGIVGEEHYARRDAGAADPAALQGSAGHHRDPRHGRAHRRGQARRLARPQGRALPLAAELRRRAVHRHPGPVRQARGHDRRLPRDHRGQARRAARSRPSTWSARSRAPSRRPRRPRPPPRRRWPRRTPSSTSRSSRRKATRSAARRRCWSSPARPARSACSRGTRRSSRRCKAGSTRVYLRPGADDVLELATGPGFFKVELDRAIALVDDAVDVKEIDDARAQEQLEAAKAELEKVDAERVDRRPLAARAADQARREPTDGLRTYLVEMKATVAETREVAKGTLLVTLRRRGLSGLPSRARTSGSSCRTAVTTTTRACGGTSRSSPRRPRRASSASRRGCATAPSSRRSRSSRSATRSRSRSRRARSCCPRTRPRVRLRRRRDRDHGLPLHAALHPRYGGSVRITLVYSNRDRESAAFLDELEQLERDVSTACGSC